MRPGILRHLFSTPAGMFYSMVAPMLAGSLGVRPGPADLFIAMAQYFLAASVALWVVRDAHARRRPACYDFGAFVFFAWTVLAPVYLFQTRGWRGFVPLGWFLLIYLAAISLGSIPLLFRS